MKLAVISMANQKVKDIEMPVQFEEPVNDDLIARAFHAIQANKRQPYGADPMAGKRASAKIKRRRRDYKTSYGIGISRVPRKTMSRRGRRFNWTAAFAPGTVSGRRAHPPKAEKIWSQKINLKEKRKAICSAISATMQAELVKKRGHEVPTSYPFVIESGFQSVDKTAKVIAILSALGLGQELVRSSVKKVRAGKGKSRGRKYRKSKGPLIVVSEVCKLSKAARNIPGIDIALVDKLNVELLAPGNAAGRLALFTEASVAKLAEKKLFMK